MYQPKYLHTDDYWHVIDLLEKIRPIANQPCVRSRIAEILGEAGNFWPAEICHDMLDRLAAVRPTFNQPCLRSAIIEILGEIGNVWPAEIFAGAQED